MVDTLTKLCEYHAPLMNVNSVHTSCLHHVTCISQDSCNL